MNLFNLFNSEEMWQRRFEVWSYNLTDYEDFTEKYSYQNNPEAYAKISTIWWIYSEIGTLVYRELITLDDCIQLLVDLPIRDWQRWGPVIIESRKHLWDNPNYYITFEYLAKKLMEYLDSDQPDQETSRLKAQMPDYKP